MSGHGVTDRDVPWFVYGIKRLREETHGCAEWQEAGIVVAVRGLVGQNFEISCERAFRHAADPEAKTPGAIRRPFLPPAASEKPPTKRGNPHRDEECPKHPGHWPDNCAGCRTEEFGQGEPLPRQPSHADASLARALMAQTKANLCACGVRRDACVTHRETTTEEDA